MESCRCSRGGGGGFFLALSLLDVERILLEEKGSRVVRCVDGVKSSPLGLTAERRKGEPQSNSRGGTVLFSTLLHSRYGNRSLPVY